MIERGRASSIRSRKTKTMSERKTYCKAALTHGRRDCLNAHKSNTFAAFYRICLCKIRSDLRTKMCSYCDHMFSSCVYTITCWGVSNVEPLFSFISAKVILQRLLCKYLAHVHIILYIQIARSKYLERIDHAYFVMFMRDFSSRVIQSRHKKFNDYRSASVSY